MATTEYILLSFLDENGLNRTAKISPKTFDKLINSSKGRPKNLLRSKRVYPPPPTPPSTPRWFDDPGIREAFQNLQDTLGDMGGHTKTTRDLIDDLLREQEQANRAYERTKTYTSPPPYDPPGFGEPYGYKRDMPRTPKPKPKSRGAAYDKELQQLAGVENPSDTLTTEERIKLLRKAKRNCHPDTGGSHEAWVKLELMARRIGLKF